MKNPLRAFLVLMAFATAAGAQVPDHAIKLSMGGGLMVTDHGTGGAGIGAYLRLGLPRLPLLLDASVLSAPAGPPPVEFAFCPGGCAGGGAGASPYTGPTTALSLAPAIQLTEKSRGGAMLYRLGPSVSWLPTRAPGSAGLAGGYRAGVSIKLGEGTSGLLISGDYYRLLRGDTAPRWFLPITIGWQF